MIEKAKMSGLLIADFLWTNIKWHFFGSIAAVLGTGLLVLMTARQGCDGGSCGIVFIVVIPIFLILFMTGFAYACGRIASRRGTWLDLALGILTYATFLFVLARILRFISRGIYELLGVLHHSWMSGFVEAIYFTIAVCGISIFIWQRRSRDTNLARRVTICVTVVLVVLGLFLSLFLKGAW
ncbi:hypothetical protein D3C87_713650 [compost metagenome]